MLAITSSSTAPTWSSPRCGAAGLAQDAARFAELERLPELVTRMLEEDLRVQRMVERYRYMAQCNVLGRGFNYTTAFEWSLKLKELAYVAAEPYSSADFQHGPIALVENGFPVLAALPSGRVSDEMVALVRRLVVERQAELVAISDVQGALELARSPIPLPAGIPEWVSPMVCVIPAQLFCYHITRAKGLDPGGIRLAIGLEKPEDIIRDLEKSLETIH